MIEANSGIIAACLPLLRQPFLTVFRCFSRSTNASNRARTHSYEKREVRQHQRGNSILVETVDIEASGMRESQEEMVKKGGDIYVMSDVSVTSTPRRDEPMVTRPRPFD